MWEGEAVCTSRWGIRLFAAMGPLATRLPLSMDAVEASCTACMHGKRGAAVAMAMLVARQGPKLRAHAVPELASDIPDAERTRDWTGVRGRGPATDLR